MIGKNLGTHRRAPLKALEGEYEFAVIDQHPRSDGPQEDEFNRIEVRLTPTAIMLRYEWSTEWCVITYDMIAEADKLYDKVCEQAFHDGVTEAMAATGVTMVVNRSPLRAKAVTAVDNDGKTMARVKSLPSEAS